VGWIRAYIAATTAYPFQDLAAALMQAMGYHVAWIARPRTRSMDTTPSTASLPPGHALDDALATIDRMCVSAGVKYATVP
jgi:hypothetical protein